MRLLKTVILGGLLCLLPLAAHAVTLEEVIAGPQRTDAQKARDQYRHPLKTLRFFDIKPDMTVVEVLPIGGWYTSILAPYLKDHGTYYAALFRDDPNNAYTKRGRDAFVRDYVNKPDEFGNIKLAVMDPAAGTKLVPDGTADRVLTFRNVHTWMAQGQAQAAFKLFYDALKPGGILGVVEHRAHDEGNQDPRARSGYVQQSYVVKLATEAGFLLVGQSEVNANPLDTKNYPQGVWTLPPSLRLGETDRAKYVAIGESDRMTLKFVKPGGPPVTDDRPQRLHESLQDLKSGGN